MAELVVPFLESSDSLVKFMYGRITRRLEARKHPIASLVMDGLEDIHKLAYQAARHEPGEVKIVDPAKIALDVAKQIEDRLIAMGVLTLESAQTYGIHVTRDT